MNVLKRRSRLVAFRISDEEFQAFTKMCTSQGVRSMSDLARAAVQFMVANESTGPERAVAERLRVLEETVDVLSENLLQLRRILRVGMLKHLEEDPIRFAKKTEEAG